MEHPSRRVLLKAAGCAVAGALLPLHSGASTQLAPIRALLQKAPSGIDYSEAKLTIDQMVAPQYDYDAARREIDRLLNAAQRLIASVPVPLSAYEQKVEALRTVIYAPGWWNGHRPFMYDLAGDPTGSRNPSGPLLANYLETRLGQCVSMPALFLALAQRIGLDAYLSTSPNHTFVKTRRSDGGYVNHECTHDAGPARDESYINGHEISELALKNKVYLQALTPRQTVVTWSNIVMEHFHEKGDLAACWELVDLISEVDPHGIEAALYHASAYGSALSRIAEVDRRGLMTPELATIAKLTYADMKKWEAKARALGWEPLTREAEARDARIARDALEARGRK